MGQPPNEGGELKRPTKGTTAVRERSSRTRVANGAIGSQSNGISTVHPIIVVSNFRVAGALALIESDYAVTNLNLDQISSRLRITKAHLCRIFRRQVGVGVPAYIVRVRIEEAERLTKETVLSMKEIAAAVGFAYPSQLNRAFKETYGCTPTKYRSRIRTRGFEGV